MINMPDAWEYKDELSKVKVGIVDNGFDLKSEELNLSILNPTVNKAENHGTHVAGIIGAKMDNGLGISGVAPNSQLVGYDWEPDWAQKVMGGWNTTTSMMIGLAQSVQDGAKIVNFSVGKSHSLKKNTQSFTPEQIKKEGELASSYIASFLFRGYDFVVVQASGNGASDQIGVDAINNGLFASITEENCTVVGDITKEDVLSRILIVAATERPDKNNVPMLTEFSNCGKNVQIAAPGRDIYSVVVNNKYKEDTGTSMAAPMVAGVAALVWGANENLTGEQVTEILCKSYTYKAINNPNSLNTLGEYPIVDAKKAVEAALNYNATKASDIIGSWIIDTEATNNANTTSLQRTFGTALNEYGAKLNLDESGNISFYIGAGIGGEGSYSCNGEEIVAVLPLYEAGDIEELSMEIDRKNPDSISIIMEFPDEENSYQIYWISDNDSALERVINEETAFKIVTNYLNEKNFTVLSPDIEYSIYPESITRYNEMILVPIYVASSNNGQILQLEAVLNPTGGDDEVSICEAYSYEENDSDIGKELEKFNAFDYLY